MSHYEAKYGDARLTVDSAASGGRIYISAQPTHVPLNGMWIPNEDAPTVAAELLKAAGRSELAELIEAVESDRTARAEREAAAKKLQERRDAVLAALLPEAAAANNLPHPHELSTLDDRAIDRIIELEDARD